MVLKVKSVAKRFLLHALGGKIIEGCADVSFEVAAGEFLALAGPSGAGKSTVLKTIYRTYLPTAGSILYESAARGEIDLARAPEREILTLRREEIGYVSQFLRAIPRVSALELVMQPLLRRGEAPDDARERARALLGRLRLSPALYDASPATFSGGEQQRVNIARAIIWAPRLLLLDEPTASLDAAAIEVVLEELRALRARGTTMIGIFHDPRLIERVADRVYVVDAAAEGQADRARVQGGVCA